MEAVAKMMKAFIIWATLIKIKRKIGLLTIFRSRTNLEKELLDKFLLPDKFILDFFVF
jgi:hypothetical protein